MKLDKKDYRILGELELDARMPLTKLAKKVGLNKDVVRYRINNMEREGLIKGYYAVINPLLLGTLTVRMYFEFIDVTETTYNKIVSYLSGPFGAGQVFKLEGDYDLGLLIWEKSIYSLEEKIRKFRKLFGKYVIKESLSVFTEFNHYSRGYLSGASRKKLSVGRTEKFFELKESDLLILRELSENSRITTTELSSKLKIPQTTVVNKIKNLEKDKVILGYKVNLNLSLLGYENFFLEIYAGNDFDSIKFGNFVFSNKNCVFSNKVIPGADFEVEAEFKNKKELLDFIEEIKKKFKEIRKIKYHSTLEYHKVSYFPKFQ